MAESEATIVCCRCKVEKAVSQFSIHRAKKNGRSGACKECRNAKLRADRRAGKYKEWDYAYNRSAKGKLSSIKYRDSAKAKARMKERAKSPEARERARLASMRYWLRNKQKAAAHSAVAWAIKTGRIPPVHELSCRSCGKPAKEYHHHRGYEEEHWLDIIPFCIFCHNQQHVKEKRIVLLRKAGKSLESFPIRVDSLSCC